MNYTKEQQEILLQTIQARLEFNERGKVEAIQDENGLYKIVSNMNSGLIRYFESAYQAGIDKYGNIKNSPV